MSEKWVAEKIPIRETIVDIRDESGFRICCVPADYPMSVRTWNRNIAIITAAPDLLEAAKVQQMCGKPLQVNVYDEDGCEGWIWSHPDGREWIELGDWDEQPPLHPLLVAAIAKANGGTSA